jgi:hypothetical protein
VTAPDPTNPPQHRTETWGTAGGFFGWSCTCGVLARCYQDKATAALGGRLHEDDAPGLLQEENDRLRAQRAAALALADTADAETFETSTHPGYVDTGELRRALGATDA